MSELKVGDSVVCRHTDGRGHPLIMRGIIDREDGAYWWVNTGAVRLKLDKGIVEKLPGIMDIDSDTAD